MRYLTLCFIGCTRAQELVSALKVATAGVLQISMDGLNINMIVLHDINQELWVYPLTAVEFSMWKAVACM